MNNVGLRIFKKNDILQGNNRLNFDILQGNKLAINDILQGNIS